jgi:hypothetical protein
MVRMRPRHPNRLNSPTMHISRQRQGRKMLGQPNRCAKAWQVSIVVECSCSELSTFCGALPEKLGSRQWAPRSCPARAAWDAAPIKLPPLSPTSGAKAEWWTSGPALAVGPCRPSYAPRGRRMIHQRGITRSSLTRRPRRRVPIQL